MEFIDAKTAQAMTYLFIDFFTEEPGIELPWMLLLSTSSYFPAGIFRS
jgi:hypothetical protein